MKQFRKYYSTRYKSLLYNLELFYTYPEQETLHKIRVDLKKISTMNRLINYCCDKQKLPAKVTELKNLFREAGKIRELQQTHKLILKYHFKCAFEKNIIDDEYNQTLYFRKKISQYKKNIKALFERTNKFSSAVNSGCISEYLQNRQIKLQRLITPLPEAGKLHCVRKLLKDIVYLSDLKFGRNNKLEKIYDDLQNMIGKWHDKQVLINVFRENSSNGYGSIREKLVKETEKDFFNLTSEISAIQNKEFIQLN